MSQVIAHRETSIAPAPARPRRLVAGHRVAGIAAGQVLVWQLAVLGVGTAPQGPLRYAAGAAGLLAVALTVGYTRTGWWYQLAGRWLRRRTGPGPVAEVMVGEPDQPVVAWDGAAWAVVLAVRLDPPVLEEVGPDRVLPLRALADLLGDGVDGLRVVVHAHGSAAPAGSDAVDGGRGPAPCQVWVALRGPAGLAADGTGATALR